MIQAIKKEVTIQPGGRVEITSSELKPGMRAGDIATKLRYA